MKKPLRHGYTTGACAAAAAKGAATILRNQQVVEAVEITLPGGEKVPFTLHGQKFDDQTASCFVVKDAGDDPDVTNGAEIAANVSLLKGSEGVKLKGGTGIGRVTKPGLAVSVGDWAINPVPRRMITESIREVYPVHDSQCTINVEISIPDGVERARKTLNARLGIVGGLSILGTTGVVKPISAQAWTDTIDAAIDVALACGSDTVVLSTGRTSELLAQKQLNLPEEAYVMMGDHVGHALRSCACKGVREVVLACQFAKLLKIACGHEQTHVSSSELDLTTLSEWLRLEPVTMSLEPLANSANTARQVLEESGNSDALISLVCEKARIFAKQLAPGINVKVLLAGYDCEVLYFA
jgi:cobalt-precorrin-5B (C1)-methyltransferase